MYVWHPMYVCMYVCMYVVSLDRWMVCILVRKGAKERLKSTGECRVRVGWKNETELSSHH